MGGGVTVTDETVKKVKDSWDIVLQMDNCVQVAGELLFRNIFKSAPGAHKMFPFGKDFDEVEDKMFKRREFKKHAKNVVSMLDSAVQFLGPDLAELEEILVELGAKHVSHGILPEHYPIVGQALLETLGTALGDVFTDDIRESWTGVYGFITTSMLKGANESLLRLSVPVYGQKEKKNRSTKEKEITLDEYVSSMLPGQTELYYITMSADGNSGFFNTDKMELVKELQKAGVVLLHIHKNKQGMLATNLQKYLGRKMVDVASDPVDTSFLKRVRKQPGGGPPTSIDVHNDQGLNKREAEEFCFWFQSTVGEEQVEVCTPTCPHASQAARVIETKDAQQEDRALEDFKIKMVDAKKHVEINPNHPLIVEINKARDQHPFIANMLAAQIYDNCLTQAGMLQDFRVMVNRINDLSILLLQEKTRGEASPVGDHEDLTEPGLLADDDEEEEAKPAAKEERPEASSTEQEELEDDDESDSCAFSGSGADISVSDSGSFDAEDCSFDSGAFNDAESC